MMTATQYGFLVEGLFWGAVVLIVYAYVIFPLLVLLRGLLCRRPYDTAEITPNVTFIIAAHNEAAHIAEKLENTLLLDYPRDRLEVILASDGSSDGTNEIAERYVERGVKLLALPRTGKAKALNAAVAASTGQILVFSDANSMYAPDAIRGLVRPLADPQVGCVAGNMVYQKELSANHGSHGEQFHWNLDRMLKQAGSRAGNAISATGAIYAIRRCLFREVPEGVTDDFATSIRVIAQGYRLVFATDAVAYESVAESAGVEFGRKLRISTRGLRGVLMMRRLLNPFRYGFYSLHLFSQKVLRRLVVFPLLVLLVASPLLWQHGLIYQAAMLVQLGVYGLAAFAVLLGGTRLATSKICTVPLYFCLVNTASLLAAFNVLFGNHIVQWEPRNDFQAVGPGAELPRASAKGKG